MLTNLIGRDIELMRKRYNEALKLQGVPSHYQYPNLADSNEQGEPVIDSYSDCIETYIFFDGNPKIKTFKRLGWVVENSADLPFLIHCSYDLPNLQKDCIFRISGQYTGMPDRIFRVTELACDMVAPDHMTAQVIPVYDEQIVGYTNREISWKYGKSNTFLKNDTDYRGNPVTERQAD